MGKSENLKLNKIKLKEKQIINKLLSNKNKQYIRKGMLKKKIANSNIFTNVSEIDGNIIKLKNGGYAKFFRVQAIDLSLTNKQEQDLFFYTLSQVYKLKCTIKAYKLNEKINLNNNKINYEELLSNADTDVKRKILENNLDFIELLENENITYSSSYFFVLICKTKEELKNNINDFERLCNGVSPKLYITQIDNKKELYKILTNLYFSKVSLDQLIHYDILELIVPMILNEKPSSLVVDDEVIQMVAIKNYPLFIDKNFLERIVNIPKVNVSFTFNETIDKEKVINIINSNYKSLKANYDSIKNISEINNLSNLLSSYQLMIEQLNNNDETIKEVTIIFAVQGTKSEREEIIDQIRLNAQPFQIKIDIPRLRQLEMWQNYDLTIESQKDYLMYLPTYTLATGFPFTKSYHNDPKGWLLGEDKNFGLPVFWDLFYKDMSKRTSFNIAIVGSTGSGKSFLNKKIIINELLRNTKVFIFDIENEYKKLTERNNGEYVNLANKTLINPLQVRYIPVDDDNEQTDSSILNRHLGFLEPFYKSVFEEISETELVVLLSITEKFYNSMGITENTTLNDFENIDSSEYPTFSDLYIYLLDYEKKVTNIEEIKILPKLELLLKRLVTGQDKIFNGHTTIELKNQLITFNFKDLIVTDNKRLANAQILNLLTYLNNVVIGKNDVNFQGKKQSILLVADEFHHFINDDNPAIIKYFDQMARKLRKYNSSILVATQSPSDLVTSNFMLRNASAIFNNCRYQFIGMLNDNDLDAIEKIYSSNPLTETQKSFLNKAELGDFLLGIASKQRLRVNIFATPLERHYMGDEVEEIIDN